MGRALAVLTLLIVSMLLPGSAGAGALEVRLGAFFPNADSILFRDDSVLYTVDKDDWIGFSGGVEYSGRIARNLELGVHVDGYSRSPDTVYRDYTDETGRDIPQTLKFEIVPVGVTLRLVAGSRRSTIVPYLGVGADLYYWSYEEYGAFIDFDDPDLPIIEDAFYSDGITGGGHVVAGLRVRLNHDVSITGEGRYHFAPTDDMDEDFPSSLQVDLSGWSATVGVRIQF
jgi:hypothetical protein